MTPHFNLLDEPWLPVRFFNGDVRDIGLLQLFQRMDEISDLADTSPPNLIAEYRLLLALTHRALTSAFGSWRDKDRARWYREGLPQDALRDYLEHWRDRFWLFHPKAPFMQVATLDDIEETRNKQKPWTQVSLASASGNMPVVFDHSSDGDPDPISPAKALRALLGFLQCTPGGLVKTIRSSDKAGPLANTAAVLPVGSTLQKTLCLALHPAASWEDLPSWEHAPLQRANLAAAPSLATGPNDRYTRLSRAVRLLETEGGQIRWLRFAVGAALQEESHAPDPMASYRAGRNSLVRLSFSEGRAFWRDLPALVPDAEGKMSQPAVILGWAANLQASLGTLQATQPLLIAGIASDQAKLLRWRGEQLTLPANLLVDARLGGFLRAEVSRAEMLHEQLLKLATRMLTETMPMHKDARAIAQKAVDTGASTASFFAVAERALPRLLKYIADGDGERASQHWSENLIKAAEACWEVLRRDLGHTPKALRAEAHAWPRFRGLLRDLQPADSDAHSLAEAQ